MSHRQAVRAGNLAIPVLSEKLTRCNSFLRALLLCLRSALHHSEDLMNRDTIPGTNPHARTSTWRPAC